MTGSATEERDAELIDMWQARPVLYEVISKGYSNRNMRMVALTEIAEEFGTTSTFSFVIHFSATPILAARVRCMFIISYNYDARIAVH